MNLSVLDAAERYILEKVREETRRTVTEKLLAEFDELLQDSITKCLSEITFQMFQERDVVSRSDYVTILVEWIKAREQKRRFKTQQVIVEEDVND